MERRRYTPRRREGFGSKLMDAGRDLVDGVGTVSKETLYMVGGLTTYGGNSVQELLMESADGLKDTAMNIALNDIDRRTTLKESGMTDEQIESILNVAR